MLAEAAPLPPQDGVWGNDSRGTASTRPSPWPARPRRDDQSCGAWAGSPFSCTRRAGGAGRDSQGRAGDGRHRGTGGAEARWSRRVIIELIISGSEPTDQPLARRAEFWRRTPCREGSDALSPTRAALGAFAMRRLDIHSGDPYRPSHTRPSG
jgi:hypothetical protein